MKLRILLAVLVILVVGGALLWIAGPREPVDTAVTFDPAPIGEDPDAYLARTEADVANLRPEAAKEIVWAYPESRARTPLAVVFVHGFSASKNEMRPLADEVARALGANLFYTRLSGHGRDGAAMAEPSVNDWLNDMAEALAIGHAIGNEVIVIGQSTGGTLAAFAATRPELSARMRALVLLSPNFGVRDNRAWLLDLPFARDILPLVGEAEFGEPPAGEAQGGIWTTRYPTRALLTMAALVRAAKAADLAAVDLPALMLYSPEDRVVDGAAARAAMARWGGPHRVVEITGVGDPNRHVVAGDALSPATTAGVAERIVYWVRSLGL